MSRELWKMIKRAVGSPLACCFFVLLPSVAWAQAEKQPNSRPTVSAGAHSQKEQVVRRAWWNQEAKVRELSLSEEQRREMDQLMTVFLDVRRKAISDQKEAFRAFGEAAVKGPAATQAAASQLVEAMAASPRAQVQLMVDVTALLSSEQTKKIVEKYPKLLSSQWVRSASPGRLGVRQRP